MSDSEDLAIDPLAVTLQLDDDLDPRERCAATRAKTRLWFSDEDLMRFVITGSSPVAVRLSLNQWRLRSSRLRGRHAVLLHYGKAISHFTLT